MNELYNKVVLGLDPSVKMLLDKIRRFITAGKASVMIGSGFSMNAENDGTGQMRTWNALNIDLFVSLYGREPTQEELWKSNPIHLAAQVESAHGQNELDEIIKNALPDKSVYPGVLHNKLMKLHWRDVFTTNYDTLLERSAEDSGTAYTLVTNKETLLYSKSPRIIKLHGSFPDIRPFIMSEESFRTYPQKFPEFVNTVRQSLIENLFCLIGFSGNDPNFLSWQGWIRDVMGEQMTNAILIDFKPEGIHLSEKQLFASRKIDILNLGEIKEFSTYKDALDFFLTYIGAKENKTSWSLPSYDHFDLSTGDRKKINIEERINDLAKARESYPGWIFLKEADLSETELHLFPFKGEFYKKIPAELKLPYLFNLDWLLDISLYPKSADWYVNALEEVKNEFVSYKGNDKDNACKLIVSLFCIYRELRQIDNYLNTLEFIENNCFDSLSIRERSIFFYEQCLWNLSILDYKDVYAVLLKWKLLDNDFVGALWQASVYRELGDVKIAEELILSYYSRLSTKMLMNDKSAFLSSCKQLYTFVISRTINKARLDIDIIEDNFIYNLKKEFVNSANKEQPIKTQTHGFNLGHVTNTTHMHQGGYVNAYLYSCKYMRLTNLHGCTVNLYNNSEASDYACVLELVSKYHFYESVARLVRSGKGKFVDQIVNREAISRVDNDEIYLIFNDLFEIVKENINESNNRKRRISIEVLIPILQRLCTKIDDDCLYEFFEFIIKNSSNSSIERNSILKTIYGCATDTQKAEMFVKVMEHPITLDSNWNDILLPDCRPAVDVNNVIYEEATKNITNKEHKKASYIRLITLMDCNIKKEQRTSLSSAVVNWRKNETKDVNAFFSYHIVKAKDKVDKENEDRWKNKTVESFLNKDFTYSNSSESIMNFSQSVDSIVPALNTLSTDLKEKVITKIIDTLLSHHDILKQDQDDSLIGGFRQFFNYMFDVLQRAFQCLNFDDVSTEISDKLINILMDCLNLNYPCLLCLCIVDNGTHKLSFASSASNRQFSKDSESRQDARSSLYYLFKTYPKDFKPSKVLTYIRSNAFFMQYSHSRTLKESLHFIAELVSGGFLDTKGSEIFCEPLLTISNDIFDYEMPFEYKTDIAHEACLLAGVLSNVIIDSHTGIHNWKEISENKEFFRDVRNGFTKGIQMSSK